MSRLPTSLPLTDQLVLPGPPLRVAVLVAEAAAGPYMEKKRLERSAPLYQARDRKLLGLLLYYNYAGLLLIGHQIGRDD